LIRTIKNVGKGGQSCEVHHDSLESAGLH
jgi:hypothetical protein